MPTQTIKHITFQVSHFEQLCWRASHHSTRALKRANAPRTIFYQSDGLSVVKWSYRRINVECCGVPCKAAVQPASGLRAVSGERYATPAARLIRNTVRSFCDIRVFRVNIEVTRPCPVQACQMTETSRPRPIETKTKNSGIETDDKNFGLKVGAAFSCRVTFTFMSIYETVERPSVCMSNRSIDSGGRRSPAATAPQHGDQQQMQPQCHADSRGTRMNTYLFIIFYINFLCFFRDF